MTCNLQKSKIHKTLGTKLCGLVVFYYTIKTMKRFTKINASQEKKMVHINIFLSLGNILVKDKKCFSNQWVIHKRLFMN